MVSKAKRVPLDAYSHHGTCKPPIENKFTFKMWLQTTNALYYILSLTNSIEERFILVFPNAVQGSLKSFYHLHHHVSIAHSLTGHTILCLLWGISHRFPSTEIYFIAEQSQLEVRIRSEKLVQWRLVLGQSRWLNPGASQSVRQIQCLFKQNGDLGNLRILYMC